MSADKDKDYDALFQERVDELLLMEQRVEARAEQFTEMTKGYQKKNEAALKNLLGKVGGIDKSLLKINAASEVIGWHVAQCSRYADNAKTFVLALVFTSLVIVVGTLWWAHHIRSDLVEARVELASLNIKLKHKPVIVHVGGKDFVRVVPKTETTLSRGDGSEVSGRYSQAWHVR